MSRRLICDLAGIGAVICLVATAHASVLVNYPNFSSTTGLTLVGSTTAVSNKLQLTPNSGGQAGAAYSTTPVTLGASDTFSTNFQFQMTNAGGIDPADGIIFVLAASATGLGTGGGDLGYGGVTNSVAIELDTFNNGSNDGNGSNHIAIDEDGNIINGTSQSDQDLTNVYGVATCDFGAGTPNTAAGCLSNGDIWNVSIVYNGTNLSMSVTDPRESGAAVIYNNLPINISSFLGATTAFVGFTAGTGSGFETQDILSWQFANDITSLSGTPEPSTVVLMGGAFLALGLVRRAKARRAP